MAMKSASWVMLPLGLECNTLHNQLILTIIDFCRELSQVDPNGEKLLDEALENDKSKEWYAKKGRVKAKA